jgi:hypothetical protein
MPDRLLVIAGMPTEQVVRCSDWQHFRQVLADTRRSRTALDRLYRGQRSPDWPLWSKWQRSLFLMQEAAPRRCSDLFAGGLAAHDAYRDSYLSLFKARAFRTAVPSPEPTTEDEWWAVARHHGLITPLLDWTRSPYVAAYFALVDAHATTNPGFRDGLEPRALKVGQGCVAIWELQLGEWLTHQDSLRIVESHWLNRWSYRLRAQSGVLIRFENDEFIDLASWLRATSHLSSLRVITVPETAIPEALLDLRDMGISEFTMFPDLDGAAREANVVHRIEFLRWVSDL